jgi:murein L,D-transpeptidase YcbB/YkuD
MKSRATVLCSILAVVVVSCALLSTSGCKGGMKAFLAKFHHRRAKSKPNTTDYAGILDRQANSASLAILRWPNYQADQPAVLKVYDDRGDELAWTRDGKPTKTTLALLQMFGDAAKKGLNPEDYDASRWAERLKKLETIRKTKDNSDEAQDAVARFDVAMTISAMRYESPDVELRYRYAGEARGVRCSDAAE